VVDRHKLTVFYLKSFDMDSVQVGKAVFGIIYLVSPLCLVEDAVIETISIATISLKI